MAEEAKRPKPTPEQVRALASETGVTETQINSRHHLNGGSGSPFDPEGSARPKKGEGMSPHGVAFLPISNISPEVRGRLWSRWFE